MATVGNTALTYADWAARLDPDNRVSAIVELLSQDNPIIEDAAVVEGNLATGHRTTVRTGLPTVTWRLLNYGVPTSKSKTKQVDDACGMLEAYAEVDKALADLNGNTAAFRLSEDVAFVEAMNQEMASAFIYGNQSTDPEKITGLAPRYNSLSAESGANIVNAGGSGGDTTSLWFVTWNDQMTHLTFPKGSQAGLQQRDLGEVTLTDPAGGLYQGYRSHYKWDIGLVSRDWRMNARLANIDVPDLQSGAYSTLIEDMIKTYYKLHRRSKSGMRVIYCHKEVRTYLHLQARSDTNVRLGLKDVAGEEVLTFLGIPIKELDGMLLTEATVT